MGAGGSSPPLGTKSSFPSCWECCWLASHSLLLLGELFCRGSCQTHPSSGALSGISWDLGYNCSVVQLALFPTSLTLSPMMFPGALPYKLPTHRCCLRVCSLRDSSYVATATDGACEGRHGESLSRCFWKALCWEKHAKGRRDTPRLGRQALDAWYFPIIISTVSSQHSEILTHSVWLKMLLHKSFQCLSCKIKNQIWHQNVMRQEGKYYRGKYLQCI